MSLIASMWLDTIGEERPEQVLAELEGFFVDDVRAERFRIGEVMILRFLVAMAFSFLLAGCGGWGFVYSDGKDRRHPLERAAQEGDVAAVRQLLASGSDPNEKYGVYGTPLTAAVQRKDNHQVIQVLLSAGADVNGYWIQEHSCRNVPLWRAASTGDLENTRTLLDAGASVQTSGGCLRVIVGWLQEPIMELLVQRGFDLKAVDERGRNALHLALAPPGRPLVETIEYLVRAGAPLNARDSKGKTPLAYWNEPRNYEGESRARITAFLQGAGAVL